MPHVIVKLWPGMTEEQKKQLAEEITKDVVNIVGCKERSVSIAMDVIEPDDWKEKIYDPEIRPSMDRLYKKPGYSM